MPTVESPTPPSSSKPSLWQRLCWAGFKLRHPSQVVDINQGYQAIEQALLHDDLPQAITLFQRTNWNSTTQKIDNLKQLWTSLVIKKSLSPEIKSWLVSQLPFIDSLPEWRVWESTEGEILEYLTSLATHNHDLFVSLVREPAFTEGWLAIRASVALPETSNQGTPLLWEDFLIHEHRARRTRSYIWDDALAKAMAVGNCEGVKWLLAKAPHFGHDPVTRSTKFDHLLSGFTHLTAFSLNPLHVARVLHLLELDCQTIDWQALNKFVPSLSSTFEQAKALLEKDRLQAELPCPSLDMSPNTSVAVSSLGSSHPRL